MASQLGDVSQTSGREMTHTPQGRVDHNQPLKQPDKQPQKFSFVEDLQPFHESLTVGELIFGGAAVLLWMVFFAVGLLVPSQRFMNEFWKATDLQQLPGFWVATSYVAVIVATYALTNVLFLACAASVLGCMAHRWQVSEELKRVPTNVHLVHPVRVYFASLLRAFFLYLLIIGGFFLVSTREVMAEVSFDQYIRVAGLVSVLGFVLGYDPNIFVRLIQRVVETMPDSKVYEKQPRDGEDAYPLGESEDKMARKEERPRQQNLWGNSSSGMPPR